jgi:hypothetical protein
MVRRLLDVALGVAGAFVAEPWGLRRCWKALRRSGDHFGGGGGGAGGGGASGPAMLRPVHAKYFGR